MKQQCKEAVAKALGKAKLNQQEAQKIEQRVRDAMKSLAKQDIDKWRNMSQSERIAAAGEQVAIDIKSDMKRKRQIFAQDALKQNQNIALLDHERLAPMDVVDRMVAPHGDMSGIQSLDSQARALASIYKGQLVDLYTNIKGAMGVFTDQKLVEDIIRERFNQDTGNTVAKQISNKMGKVFDDMRERFNRAGGDIGKLDDWGLPQTHSLEKIAKAGKEAWVAKATDLINRDKYVKEDGQLYNNDEIKELLDNAFDTLVSDGANKIEIGRQRAGGGTSKVTNKHSDSRVLHFKDADAWLDYQHEFGGTPFVDLVEAHISGLSKDIAMVENLGSNPKNAMRILMDAAERKSFDRDLEHDQTQKKRKRAETMFNEFTGGNTPQSEVLANLGIGYRSLNVASMLGGTTISSVADQATIKKTASVHGLAYTKVFGELLHELNPKNKADREQAHSLGLATEEMLGSIARWADDGLTSTHGKAEKFARVSSGIANQVMRVSGLNALTAASKIGFSKLLMEKYGRLTRTKDWNDLDANDRELLKNTGLDERAWQVMRLAEPVLDSKGHKLMSAQSIYEIPDEALKHFENPRQVREQVATQFQTHLLDEQGMAVIEGGLRERTLMSAGQQKGSGMGEIIKSMLQFKTFSAAFLMKHGSRAMAQPTLQGKVIYAASLAATMTVLGGLVVQLKELANGNNPQPMWDGSDPNIALAFLGKSVVAGGGLPVLGDIISAGVDPTGRGVSDFLVGPLGSDIKTALGVTVGNANQWYDGKDTNAANEAFKAIKSKIPAQNLWYTKLATNRLLFDNFQDMIAPGYREKVLRKAQRQQHRTRWWGDDFDVDAPNFSEVIQ
ncbi:hypothetical protein [Acinetobacter sp. HY1485]|uniref:hypothetical protein n=1 Tax=Acinetobacter sp. HY1485 TaxID=2970918 RepID=UPI0022B96427|nr:hypothetical protein [Acinetobacter sp. HY1485]